jgi:hypothetical protein
MMIVPEEPSDRLDKVFMLKNPAHMLTKLHWEIYNLKKTLSEQPEHIGHIHAPAYCAFNCAVTAWHMTDWIWQSSSSNHRLDILQSLGVPAGKDDEKDFAAFCNAVRSESRPLHICRQIATGSKHMIVSKYPDPAIRAETGLEITPARAGSMRAGDPLATFAYRLVISDGESKHNAVQVFTGAFKSWERSLGNWGFIEGTVVRGRPLSV